MSQTGASYPGKGISYVPDTAFNASNPLKYRSNAVIQVSMISKIKPNGSNSILVIHGVNGEISMSAEALWASGTAASYAAQSGQHVLLTDATTSDTFYLNADMFKGVQDIDGVDSLLQYGTEGAQFESITVVGTAATIQAAFDAAANNSTANSTSVVAAGVNQGTATVVTGSSPLYVLITGGTGGIRLPAATVGSFINVDSQVGVDLNIYPAVGGYINDAAVNVPFVMQANGNASFVCNTAGYWIQAENTFPVVNTDSVQAIGASLELGAGGSAGQVITSAKNTDRIPRELYSVDVRLSGGTATATANIIDVSSNSAATNILQLSGTLNWYIIQNNTATSFVLQPPATGNIEGLSSITILPEQSIHLVSKENYGDPAYLSFELLCVSIGTQSGVASTTQTQAAGTLIQASCVNAITVANAGDAFTISPLLRSFTLVNSGANESKVFPPVGGSIEGFGVDAFCQVYPDSTIQFTSNDGLIWKLRGTRTGTSVFNGAGGLFTVADTNIRATSNVSVSTTSIAATTAVGFSTAITAVTGFTTTNFDAAGAVVADTRTTSYVINY